MHAPCCASGQVGDAGFFRPQRRMGLGSDEASALVPVLFTAEGFRYICISGVRILNTGTCCYLFSLGAEPVLPRTYAYVR